MYSWEGPRSDRASFGGVSKKAKRGQKPNEANSWTMTDELKIPSDPFAEWNPNRINLNN